MLFRVRIPLILGVHKIIQYIQYIVRVSRQNVLEWSHKTHLSYVIVLFTCMTIPLAKVMFHTSRKRSTSRATSLALANGFLVRGSLFVVRETRLLLKCLLHSAQGILTAEKAHGGLVIQSLHV